MERQFGQESQSFQRFCPFKVSIQAVAVLVLISRGATFKGKNRNYRSLLLRLSSAGSGGRILQSPGKKLEIVTVTD